MNTVRVWDLPTRLFHWALVLCVVGLIVTANVGGNWMTWHMRLGYSVLTLLLFRLIWGFVGGHWSRFSTFVHGPGTVVRYLKGMSRPEHGVGHNPLGALSVLALLTILLLQVSSGLFSDDEIAFFGPLVGLVSGETVSWATAYHKNVGKVLVLALVSLHLLAIAFYRISKKENLVRPMITGDKVVSPSVPNAADTSGRRWLALLILALSATAVYGLIGLGASPAG